MNFYPKYLGFKEIEIIDLDTIDISNLNRQVPTTRWLVISSERVLWSRTFLPESVKMHRLRSGLFPGKNYYLLEINFFLTIFLFRYRILWQFL